MRKLGNIGFWLCCTFLFFIPENIKAQLQQLPVSHKKASSPSVGQRLQQETLTLPFWDDFSTGILDTAKWENSGTVVSRSVGINPVTQGGVILDGTDERGAPYSTRMREQGLGDQLSSWPFNLSGLTPEQISSLYLSFSYQAGGKAEFPDGDDFLEVHLMDTLGNWQMVWEMPGGDLSKREIFTQVFVQIPAEFVHDNFRFKFQNRGRLSGPFDSWIVDYVFLNTGRNPSNTHFPDRALTKLPSSPLGRYTAIPYFEYQAHPELYSGIVASQFHNLDNRFRAMEYTVQLRNAETGAIIQNINSDTPFNPVPLSRERRDFISNPFDELDADLTEGIDLEAVIYLTTGDNYLINSISGQDTVFQRQVDFRVNDTIRQTIPLRDYFAYDNNSIDYAAGINQRAGMLAVRYEIEEEAYVNGLSINFTNFVQIGSPIEILVWNSLDQDPIYARERTIPQKESLREISFFPLDTLLRVQGEFYVGYRQFTNDFIHVGLDKTNDSGEEIFYNVTGAWAQNQIVEGSLLLRPHLTQDAPEETVEAPLEVKLRAYPNPVTERLVLEGATGEVTVYDSFGRQIQVNMSETENGKVLDFIGKQKGVYLIRTNVNQKPTSIRILVK
ncbi:T9SS type A sorting domain-containing protein [Litoribacter ruber]|uniref:T9SS type A sorting domain-containing protein n=1 Tax=Litoribacter ruber TaxID=702568 RepID=UPI001BDA4468|nr:T9SS type A sorting domain-containing protein [Litoribacter ruber]MBT0810603.1 T9SS type A sorting domain-containing protein [Litoribacter ruber]